ncbi:MAG: IS5 family transposase [Chitinophagaceae bacterium]
MYCKYANLTKDEIEKWVLPFIPKNNRGFASRFEMGDIFKCIVHKLKTGCQWSLLFVDIECVKPPSSWQTVYYYYRKWCEKKVFEAMFCVFLQIQKDRLDTERLNLDGTQGLVKRAAESAGYQWRKRGRTSNLLVLTDGNGIPVACGGVLDGRHNDLYDIVPQYAEMTRHLGRNGICVENSIQNADKGFDSKAFRRAVRRRKMTPNIKENPRGRKGKKKGRKREFNSQVYETRFVNERYFAWMDSFRTLLIRFDALDSSWLNWHYLAFALILLKV